MSRRYHVNKGASASQFRRNTARTKTANINRQVMRGGWRL